MTKILRLLLVEDSPDDALLLERHLRRAGIEPRVHRVDTAAALDEALGAGDHSPWDIVISDYSMPNFSGLAALEAVRRRCPNMPFIVVSGVIGEEAAVEAMRRGAHDYVMKQNLNRLVPAIERELQEAETRRARRQIEERPWRQEAQIESLINRIPDIVWTRGADGSMRFISAKITPTLGYVPQDLTGPDALKWSDLIYPADRERVEAAFEQLLRSNRPLDITYMVRSADHQWRWVHDRSVYTYEQLGEPFADGLLSDITERKQRETLDAERLALRSVLRSRERMTMHAPIPGEAPAGEPQPPLEPLIVPIDQGEPLKELIARTQDRVTELTGAIDDLLDLLRLRTHAMRWKWQRYSLDQTATRAVASVRPLIDESKISLHIETPAALDGMGDPDAIRRLLLLLLGNSYRFTLAGLIKLRIKTRDVDGERWATIEVTDTGTGLPAVAIDQSKAGLEQVQSPETPQGRLAIQLAICRSIAAAHGGRLDIGSHPDTGTRTAASIRLDLERPAAVS